jgi:Lrp/AsnC family leucine-responsive transcriptional regulator
MKPREGLHLNRNDKAFLTAIIANGRSTDIGIARELRITPQAVGKIRGKLEDTGIIKGYSADIDYITIGINVIAIVRLKVHPLYNRETHLWADPCMTQVYALPGSRHNATHIAICAFRDIHELSSYFAQLQTSKYENLIQVGKIDIISAKSLVKNSAHEFLYKTVVEFNKERVDAKPNKFYEVEP